MCGIAGFTHKDDSPDPSLIRSAVATLVHRGPDQQDVFESGMFSMGAARLRIIDLESGRQPMLSQAGDTGIVFNGEIYNHRELRAELSRRGHRFRSQSDTETVLNAFLEWDTECFARFRGMFAVALWNGPGKRLVLARDRMGIKPLYLARHGQDLIFGSELKTLLVHPEVGRTLSMQGLDCYLSLNYVPCPWTLIDGIKKLHPGTWLEWVDGESRTESYWKLPYGHSDNWTVESAQSELDCLLSQSVREHLASDVPVGVWLSGGVDSSTILHYAAQASKARLKTFSVSFKGRSFDESQSIQKAVEQYGTDHEEIDLQPNLDLVDAIEEFAYYSDEPTADAGALPVWFLSKITKKKATVALSGDGADELFGGYVTYRANQWASLARRLPVSALKMLLKAVQHWPVSDDKISFEYKAKRFLQGCRMPADQAHVFWNGTFSRSEKEALLATELPDTLDGVLSGIRHRRANGDGLSPFMWFDQRYYLVDDILAKVDRMSMAHAVEVRPPFLDHRIVAFAASLPASLKVRGSRQKVLLRRLMEGKIPPTALRRKKIGFDIPAHDWLRGVLRPLLVETLRDGAATYNTLFHADAIESCLRDHLERRVNRGYHLWGLMILFLWMKKWRIQAPSLAGTEQNTVELALTSI